MLNKTQFVSLHCDFFKYFFFNAAHKGKEKSQDPSLILNMKEWGTTTQIITPNPQYQIQCIICEDNLINEYDRKHTSCNEPSKVEHSWQRSRLNVLRYWPGTISSFSSTIIYWLDSIVLPLFEQSQVFASSTPGQKVHQEISPFKFNPEPRKFSSFFFLPSFFSLLQIDDLRKSRGLHSVSAYGHGLYI